MDEDHTFSCDIDYTNQDPNLQILFEKQLTFDTIFYNLRNTSDVPAQGVMNQ